MLRITRPMALISTTAATIVLVSACATATEPAADVLPPPPTAPADVAPTQVVEQPTPTASEPDPRPGWAGFSNPAYGFALRHPPGWQLEEEPDLIKLSQEPYVLAISYRYEGEEIPPPWTGMPAGEFETRDPVEFMGYELAKDALVFEDKVKVLLYDAAVDELLFAIRVDDMSQADDYEMSSIPEEIEAEVDDILRSFELLPTQ